MNPHKLLRQAIQANKVVPKPVLTEKVLDYDAVEARGLTEDNKLTPEQIKNWRHVLLGLIGPYALIASDADIQQMRDAMNKRLST